MPALAVVAVLLVQLVAAELQRDEPHPCERPCVRGQHLTCRYHFHVENYHSLSKACYACPWNVTDCARPDCIAADGVPRALVVVNRQLPGPSLQVCLGDRIEVTVHNHMPEQSTSVHWHGLLQHGTPYMDGVPFVTQCPITPHSTFRYSFRAESPGTQFWHSHTGCQRADGAVGFFTVRVPPELNPHADLYDEDRAEHGLLVLDWTHQLAASKFLAHHHAGDDNKADAVLINGKGVYRKFVAGKGEERHTAFTPREVFKVQKGLRYRFRIVNAGFLNCPLELSVDNHTMLVIASDGFDVQPVRVDSLVSYAGERWDVIIEADQSVGSYWVRLHGLLDCGPRRAHEAAVLRYHDADPNVDPTGPLPAYDVPRRGGLQVNALNRGSAQPGTLTVAELRRLPPSPPRPIVDPALKPQADMQLFVSYDFYALDNPLIHRPGLYGITQVPNSPHRVYTPQLNHISLSLPPFPLLPSRDRILPGMLCNETLLRSQGRNCSREYCECTHTVHVPLGAVLEIILVDQGVRYDANHPFHLHGHSFRVVGLERLGSSTSVEEVQRLDAEGQIARNLEDPPIKDTVTVPDGGYTVLRVLADNPGYWLFHCHIEFHVELGMALVIKVGEHEDMPPVPHGFPQCGDWSNNDWLGDEEEEAEGEDDSVSSNHIGRAIAPIHRITNVSPSPVPEKLTNVNSSTPTTQITASSAISSPFSSSPTTIAPSTATFEPSHPSPSSSLKESTTSTSNSNANDSWQTNPAIVTESVHRVTTVIDSTVTVDLDSTDDYTSTEAAVTENVDMDLNLYRAPGNERETLPGSKFKYSVRVTSAKRRVYSTAAEPLSTSDRAMKAFTLSEVIMRVSPRAPSARTLQYNSIQEPVVSGRPAHSGVLSERIPRVFHILVPILSIAHIIIIPINW